MVVERNMAASNPLSTVNAPPCQRRSGPSQSAFQQQLEQDLVRLHTGGCESKHPQSRAEFLSAKDASKRKRVNRTARLKQCKQDARREQWLSQGLHGSQGSQGKQGKPEEEHQTFDHPKTGEASSEYTGHDMAGTSGHCRSQLSGSSTNTTERTPVGSPAMNSRSTATSSSEGKNIKKEVPVRRPEHVGGRPKYFGDEEVQHGGVEHKQDAGNGWSSSDASTSQSKSSCASSSYTGSGSEDNNDTHDAEDDWEVAADALYIQGSPYRCDGTHKGPNSDRVSHPDGKDSHEKKSNGLLHSELQSGQLKPEYKYKNSGFGGRRGNGGRAWRPDDVSRPPTLPRLTKQHSYPIHQSSNNNQGWGSGHGNMWGPPPTPSYCPICTEELDMTDSSYIPCTCGFQLCLFCHHRIASDDGRCPGCRKAYNPEAAVKLSRSSSVWLRV